MKKTIFFVLILVGWSTSLSARIYHSPFGFSIEIPNHWFVLSKQVLKDNPDLIGFAGSKNIDKVVLNQAKNMVLSGEFEFYANLNSPDVSINVCTQTGRLPQTVSESKAACRRLLISFIYYFDKNVKLYACELRKVAGLKAFCVETDGVVDGTRSVRYSLQMSSNEMIVFTATCENQNLKIMKREFEEIVSSIKIE